MNEREFWNNKYREGGISGKGSIGKYRIWKWDTINYIIDGIRDKSVIDVGCGDMSFWKYLDCLNVLRRCKDYLGIDISFEIILRNIVDYPNRNFMCCNAKDYISIKGDVVLAMDLLFHIMNEKDFEQILDNLCVYSDDWIIIYNWIVNPFKEENKVTNGKSQYYRNLIHYDDIFACNNFDLKRIITSPFDSYGALYFYREMIY